MNKKPTKRISIKKKKKKTVSKRKIKKKDETILIGKALNNGLLRQR